MKERTCSCGETFARRKRETCPACGRKVIPYHDQWVTELPTQKILTTFETLIREQQKRQGFDGFLFKITRDRIGKETQCANLLLESAEGDVDLVCDTMVDLGSGRDGRYFLSASSLWMVKDMIIRNMARVYHNKQRREKEKQRQEKMRQELEERYGDLF